MEIWRLQFENMRKARKKHTQKDVNDDDEHTTFRVNALANCRVFA